MTKFLGNTMLFRQSWPQDIGRKEDETIHTGLLETTRTGLAPRSIIVFTTARQSWPDGAASPAFEIENALPLARGMVDWKVTERSADA
jgi:hypothetical protein